MSLHFHLVRHYKTVMTKAQFRALAWVSITLAVPACDGTMTGGDSGTSDVPITDGGSSDSGPRPDGGRDGGGMDGGLMGCALDNGGCDALAECTDGSSGPVCGACPDGYSGTGDTECLDVDECTTDNGGCDDLATCTNSAGDRTCGICPLGYTGTGDTACLDVDECTDDTDGCDPTVECNNTAGSFTCGDCPTGYTGGGATGCTDIDECDADNGGCDALTTCMNEPGTRTCGACLTGYTGDGATGCVDVNECDTDNGGCDALTTCMNVGGSRTCGACPTGYTGDGEAGCMDINECATGNGGCDLLTTCMNIDGGRTCGACPTGYVGDGVTGCMDIDECTTGNGGCDVLTMCMNIVGGRTCGACPTGYAGDGATGCMDINECAVANGGCDALTTCTNIGGGRTCGACPAGYSGTGATSCTDIDECATANGGCGSVVSATCMNNVGGAPTCSCNAGYQDNDSNGTCELACGASSCSELYRQGVRADGIYEIDPDGAGGNAAYDVYCLMTVAGGGWTEVLDQNLATRGVLPKASWPSVNPTQPNGGLYSILDQLGDFANTDGTYELYMDWPGIAGSYAHWTQSGSPMVWTDGARGTVNVITLAPAGLRGDSGGFNGLARSSAAGAFLDIDNGGSWWGAVGTPVAFNGGIPAYRTAAGAETIAQHGRLFVRTTSTGSACGAGASCDDSSGTAMCVSPASCAVIHTSNPTAPSGTYTIDPDGAAGAPAFSVTCDMTTAGGGWTVISSENFTGGATGWSDNTTSTACAYTTETLGGYLLTGAASSRTKTFALLGIPHTEVRVALNYYAIDSWDGEFGVVQVDGSDIFRQSINQSMGGSNRCGGGWNDQNAIAVASVGGHTAATLTVLATSTLDQDPSDESWAIDDVVIMIR